MRRIVAVLVLLAVASVANVGGAGPTTAVDDSDSQSHPEIVAIYPNPIPNGDPGEYVALSVPKGTDLDAYTLADDDSTVDLPNVSANGRVVVTGNASHLPSSVTGKVVSVSGFLQLANAGERVTLQRTGDPVDSVSYADAPEGEIKHPGADRPWRPLAATDFDVVVADGGTVRAFALPDAPAAPVDALRDADRRILLAGYTLTSRRVVNALLDAKKRGVAVAVLVDGGPVGGITNRSADALDRLSAANVTVRAVGGPAARYRFHHAKYAVVDDSAVVTTENWKPAGVGGASSRGWGVVVDSQPVVAGLVETFRADSGWRDSIPWRQYRETVSVEPAAPKAGQYPARIEPKTVSVDRVELIVAPDNAVGRVRAVIGNATDSINVMQVSIGGRSDPLLRETVDAARRGVDVEILLSSAWYVREDNRRLARNLNRLADREDIPLTVRLADPDNRYGKIHTKGVIVDGDAVVLGSLNWNDNAYRNNREVAVVLQGTEVGKYYGKLFRADWRGGVSRVPIGLLVTLLLAVVGAGVVGRKIRFEPD